MKIVDWLRADRGPPTQDGSLAVVERSSNGRKPEQAGPAKHGRFVALDGLRGVAAIIVATTHFRPVGNATLAVDFFFMLSGFVLMYAYSERLFAGFGIGRFMLARCVRLLPLIVLGTLIGAISLRPLWLWGAFMIPRVGTRLYPLNSPQWSLLFEFIGSALLAVGLWRRFRIVSIGLLILTPVALVVAAIHNGTLDSGWALPAFHYGLVRVLFGFSVGTYLFRHPIRIDCPGPVLALILLVELLLPIPSPFFQLAVIATFPFILSAAARARPFPLAEVSGNLSYPLYILHVPIYGLLGLWLAPGPVYLLVAVTVSALALKIYDEPLRHWLSRRLRRPLPRDERPFGGSP
ncbi:acyltransferase [Sphingomonas sp. ASV193]|uniref:acyltransferase family protein n=1 Tax=Sphingomonas sp. ASV193 TaxID=3144405 RepID=UPI0032E8E6C1